MKILAIRGRNIASLAGDFEIDFTAEPLRSAGIFAIAGATGSGKSTLLDTMCLALFARTPRTDQAKESEVNIQDVQETTIKQGDPRALLRRNTASGFAEVDFIALNGNHYRARWSVRRARDKASGAMQNYDISLFNLTKEEPEQGNKKEFLSQISLLIGLTFEQFTRAVLLAQNDFATFLKADQSEKASLLEKLTGTEQYSAISQRIYSKHTLAKQQYEQLSSSIASVELLSSEDFIAEEETLQQAQANMLTLEKEKQSLEKAKQWLKTQAELQQQLADAVKELDTNKLQQAGAADREAHLKRVDLVQGVRTLFDTLQAITKQLSEKQAQQTTISQLQTKSEAVLKEAKLRYQQAEALEQQAEQTLRTATPLLQQARTLDMHKTENARFIAEHTPQLNKINTQLIEAEEKQTANKELVKQTKTTLEELTTWSKKYASKADIVENQAVLLVQLKHAEETQQEITRCSQLVDNFKTEQAQRLEEISKQQKELQALQDKLDKSIATGEALRSDVAGIDPEKLMHSIQFFRQKREGYMHDRTVLISSDIQLLRSKLSEGAPCPLCGSEHHPYQGSGAQEWEGELNHLIALAEKELKALEQQEKAYRLLLEGQQAWTEKHAALNKTASAAERNLSQTESKLLVLQEKTIQLETQIKEHNSALSASLKACDLLFGHAAWQPAWREACVEFRKQLILFASQWQENKQKSEACSQLCNKLETEIESIATILPVLKEQQENMANKLASHENSLKQLTADREKIFEGVDADTVEQELQAKQKAAQDNLTAIRHEQNRAMQQLEQYNGSLSQLKIDIANLHAQSLSNQQNANKWLTDNLLTEAEVYTLLSQSNEWIQEERKQLDTLASQVIATQAKVSERSKQLATHSEQKDLLIHAALTHPEIEDAGNKLSIAIEKTHTALQASSFKLQAHRENINKIKHLEEELNRKRSSYEQWAKLNDLAGSADGGKFRRIAQGYTLDMLLRYANRQLQELSKRYRLERVQNTLALQVIDQDMCDEIRTVHSLSGGESFLVSLALALGLSSLSSNRMKVESLFIDEGFGSLDAETLRVAMDALEQLQTQGRKIGVISHVQEMSERIPVQIRVEKAGNGKSLLEIIG